jgi:hypothetical protein
VSYRKGKTQDNEISINYSTYHNPAEIKAMSSNHTATISINYKREETERQLDRRTGAVPMRESSGIIRLEKDV